jgi:hypothetical protein
MSTAFILLSISVLAIVLAIVAWRTISKARIVESKCDKVEALIKSFAVDISASPLCCASIVHLIGDDAICECHVCRRERGHSATEESQELAQLIQQQAAGRIAEMLGLSSRWRRAIARRGGMNNGAAL